jgi:phage gp36-like protein
VYLTAAELLDRMGPRELAELATPDDAAVVDAALLRLTINVGDRSGFDPGEIAVADEAVVRIGRALADGAALIDGYLATRYTLPLTVVPAPLKRIATDVARFYLMGQRATDEVRQRYDAQLKLLGAMRDGDFTLGAEDPAPDVGLPAVSAPGRTMTRDRLAGY